MLDSSLQIHFQSGQEMTKKIVFCKLTIKADRALFMQLSKQITSRCVILKFGNTDKR